MPKNIKIIVSGKVQGVYYRASLLKEAERLGLKGFVENKANGNVEAIAYGEEEGLMALVEWCKLGPPLAVVSDVKFAECEAEIFENFSIRR